MLNEAENLFEHVYYHHVVNDKYSCVTNAGYTMIDDL